MGNKEENCDFIRPTSLSKGGVFENGDETSAGKRSGKNQIGIQNSKESKHDQLSHPFG